MKLFSLYKMGPNEPEYTGVTRVEKKKKNTHPQHIRPRRKKWPPHKPMGRLADENSSQPKYSDHKEEPRETQEGHHSTSPRRSNRTALDRRDLATTLHRRRNRREARNRDHPTHRHHPRRGGCRRVARGRDDATTPVCRQLESKGIAKQRHTH
jgi:hypothetical protein